MEYIVTSKTNPNLDEIASMHAYCEFINKLGFQAGYYISGNTNHAVVQFCDANSIVLNSMDAVSTDAGIIIIGTCDTYQITKEIQQDKVTEIVLNKEIQNNRLPFDNANIQIETVAALSTLITQRFREHHMPISRESTLLLYHAIMECTNNSNKNEITDLDRKVVSYLKENLDS
ncbi:MAG: hypothetical protein PHP54_04920 [Clostridia bacterium]|nr:hypothetical protein [Clostridia bacterium]